MFEEKRPLFIYCVSPVHVGAGTALGVIDNPIQRERHTDHPVFSGAGLKGAIRHDFWAQAQKNNAVEADLITRVFGPSPEEGGSLHAGAISFSDAQLVAFPVRSIREAFVYTSCPTALARAERTLRLSGCGVNWNVARVPIGKCLLRKESLKSLCSAERRLPLEAFEFEAQEDSNVANIANWLAEQAILDNPAFAFFREKMKQDFVVLSDEDFGYFVRNATVVEPHVRIDDVTGTADDGGLFYTENLPPESLLLALAMASEERTRNEKRQSAKKVIEFLLNGKAGITGVDGRLIQIGGDATTGRGQVVIKSAGGNDHA